MAIHYGLFESQINLLNEAKTYIEKKNIIEPKSKSLNIKDVSKLMEMDGYTNIYTLKDLQQIDRVVIGTVL